MRCKNVINIKLLQNTFKEDKQTNEQTNKQTTLKVMAYLMRKDFKE